MASTGLQPREREFQYFLHSSAVIWQLRHRNGHASAQPTMDSADTIYSLSLYFPWRYSAEQKLKKYNTRLTKKKAKRCNLLRSAKHPLSGFASVCSVRQRSFAMMCVNPARNATRYHVSSMYEAQSASHAMTRPSRVPEDSVVSVVTSGGRNLVETV